MKDDRYIVGILQEYCDKVDMQPGGDAVEVVVQGKYFTELYTRVMLHGWACLSIMSDDNDIQVATFVENSVMGFLEKFMDDDIGNEFEFPNEDDGDWWKKSK